jgi:Ca2+-binding EF-hand superfamily protein
MKRGSWAALAVLLCISPAWGQDAPPVDQPIHHTEAAPAKGEADSFANHDHDADGFIQWEEMRNVMVKAFHDADHDHSGWLAGDELKIDAAQRAAIDVNKDGKLSQREFIAYAAAAFGQADVDADEKLSRAEATADLDVAKEKAK